MTDEALVAPEVPEVPEMEVYHVDLSDYDRLLDAARQVQS